MTIANTYRPLAIARGVAITFGAIAFLLGIPWALVHFVGNPMPAALPSLQDVQYAITNGQVDHWSVAKGAALVVWLSWAHLATSLAVEVAAAARGGTAAAVRGLGATQWIAAKIVSQFSLAVAILFQSTVSVAGAAVLSPLPTIVASSVEEPPTTGIQSPAPGAVDDSGEPGATEGGRLVEVGRRDTLWGLAEQHLDDGHRWEEIRDANVGRTMSDGSVLVGGFTSLNPGWTLMIPGLTGSPAVSTSIIEDSAQTEVETGTDSATGEWIIGSWRVEQGDHLWRISEEILEQAWGRSVTDVEIAPYWADVVEANRQHLISPGDDPNLIYPDQRFEILLPPVPVGITSAADRVATTTPFAIEDLDQFTPTSPHPRGSSGPDVVELPAPEPAAPLEPTPIPDEVSEAPLAPAPSDAQVASVPELVSSSAAESAPGASPVDAKTMALGLFATAVGAGALMVVLRHRRSLQAARRRPNTVIEEAPIIPSDFEERIRPIGDTEAVRWLASTNRFLTHQLGEHPENPLPAVVAMRAGRFGVEILLDEACQPVDGFINGGAEAKAWRIHPDLEQRMIERTGALAQPYSPALLPVGSTDAGDLLIDFEQVGALGVTGDATTIIGWLNSLAVAVTSSPWAQDCEVVAIGLDADLAAIPQVTVPADPAEWAKEISAIHTATAHRLDASTYENRVNPGEIHHPQIILIGPGHEGIAQYLEETAQLAFSPLAVIAAAPLRSETRIDMQPTLATIEPLAVDFVPATTTTEAILIATACLEAASNTVTTPDPEFFGYQHPVDNETPAPAGVEPQSAVDVLSEPLESGMPDEDDVGLDEALNLTGEVVIDRNHVASRPAVADPSAEDSSSLPVAPSRPTELEGFRVQTDTESTDGGDAANDEDREAPPFLRNGNSSEMDGGEDDAPEGAPSEAKHETGCEKTAIGVRPPLGFTEPDLLADASPSAQRMIEAIMTARPIEAQLLRRVPVLHGLDEEPQAKIEAVIIYMAFTRNVASERIRRIFWPTSVSRGTSDNAIAKVRRLLGQTDDGEARLSLATNTGRFEVSEEIGCDWNRVQALVQEAKSAGNEMDEMACLRQSLRLVEGRPAADSPVKLYAWFTDDYEVYTHVETVLVDAAYRLGELAIKSGDSATARWAATQGLVVVPGQEALHRIQMKAASLAGDAQGIEDAYRAATRSAEALSAWEDVQPETDDLYNALTRRSTGGRTVSPWNGIHQT